MLASPAYADNAPLAAKNAGDRKDNPNCVGQSISPPLNGRTRRTGPRASPC